jgi:NAD(P)-dependent dehydrogenase (short-subunit alcohol dehydrogenase family)
MGREPHLAGRTLLVIGGSSGIGLETARRARRDGAEVILTARDPDRVHRAGLELGASIAASDATDFRRLGRFVDALPTPIDHILVTGAHAPTTLSWLGSTSKRLAAFWTPTSCFRCRSLLRPRAVRPGGTLLFIKVHRS